MFESFDQDNDGAILDDLLRTGADKGGNFLMTGGFTVAALGASASLGPKALGPLALPLALGGGLAAGAGFLLNALAPQAEEVGDFFSDLMGTRGERPHQNVPSSDPDYAPGAKPGLGKMLNRWWPERRKKTLYGTPRTP